MAAGGMELVGWWSCKPGKVLAMAAMMLDGDDDEQRREQEHVEHNLK